MRQPSPGRFSERLSALAAFALPLLLACVFGVRALLVESIAGSYTGCRGCYIVPTLGSDAWLLVAGLGLLALSWAVRVAVIGVLARIVVGLLLLIAAIDVVLLDLLAQRLHLDDVVRFGGAVGNNWSVLRASLGGTSGALRVFAAILIVVVVLAGCAPSRRRPQLAATCAALALAALVFAVYARSLPLRYVHASYADNVVTINLPQGRIKAYSEPYIARARETIAAMPQVCEQRAPGPQPDVIVLMVESLSAWHSRLLGSTLDWTPRLDAIARANHYFARFHANGFTTSGAEIALITGRVPFNPPGVIEFNFDNYALPLTSLPALAKRAGYRSDFFTPGDSSFLQLGTWLRELDFDGVHDSNDAFYAGHRRWQFHAAEDRAFYDRYLQWVDAVPDGERFISLMLTVTTHPPFVDPETAQVDPQAAFRYVDDQVGRFHDALRERGFFEHGVLIVLGDHRSMTPLHADEFAAQGERAFAHVPLVVVGAVDMPKIVESPFQQSDLLPSLGFLIGERTCRDAFTGSFLRADPQPPQYLLHVRGDDRNRIDVYHGNDEVSGFRLDGDASRWLDSAPADGERIAAWIAVQRADAVARREVKEGQAGKKKY